MISHEVFLLLMSEMNIMSTKSESVNGRVLLKDMMRTISYTCI